jgi:hypothetical protein
LLADTVAPTPLPQTAIPRSTLPSGNSPRQRENKVRIVVTRIQLEGAEFDNVMTCCNEPRSQVLLQPKPAVIGGNSNAHVLSSAMGCARR